jgi:hypothetical protein
MGKDKVTTDRGGAGVIKPARQKVRYGYRNGQFVWLPPKATATKKKKKKLRAKEGGDGTELPGKLSSGDLDNEMQARLKKVQEEKAKLQMMIDLLRSPEMPPPPPVPTAPMLYEDLREQENTTWVTEENDKAGRVLPQLAQLLGLTVDHLKDIEWEMYQGDESLTACGNICLVYAGGLMMRWIRMVPFDEMRIWEEEASGPASVLDSSALSAELLARRWQKLRSLGVASVAAIFTISMCVATKQINTTTYIFHLKYCMPALRSIRCSFPLKVASAMEKSFLRQLRWRTHLRMRSSSPEFPDLALCEYDHILESLPALMESGEVAWDRLCGVMAAIGDS